MNQKWEKDRIIQSSFWDHIPKNALLFILHMLYTFFVCAQNKFVRILPCVTGQRCAKSLFLLYMGAVFCGHFWFCGLLENTLLQNTLFTLIISMKLFTNKVQQWICCVYRKSIFFSPFFSLLLFSKNNENSNQCHTLYYV